MAPITAYLPVWKDKLKKAKSSISKQLEDAKNNGGKTPEVRARLKQELSIAKGLKKTIKEIENAVTKTFECPCCGCKFKIHNGDDGDQCLMRINDEENK